MQSINRSHAVCLIVATVVCAMPGCARDESSPRDSQPLRARESALPPVRLLDLDGQPVDLLKHQPGPVTVVLFTRTDCPVSNRCAPEIRRLHEAYHPRGVEFVLVYVDPHESPDAIRRHLREYDYPCRALRDPEHTLVAHCNATTTPEAVVFGRDRTMTYRGRVDDRYVDVGRPRAEPTTRDLADAIESTVSGRRVTNPRTKAVGCLIADLKN
jgi:Redoxin